MILETNRKLIKITAAALVAVGASLFFGYLLYVVAPGLFSKAAAENLGLILYGLATAGAAFVSWGLILTQLTETGLDRRAIMKATGVGLAMLALMRLGVAVFPHGLFEQIRYLPISECILFGLLAIKFLRS
ncbi:MAG: hypothetical protein R3208_00840 [Ketobacteraceae bacterium]|nr:hypothetical protein [Ketobacteraceae bacterium]